MKKVKAVKATPKKTTREVAVLKNEKPLVLTDQKPLNNKQLMFMIQSTPPEHIYTRPAKGGGTWNYVTGTYVKKILNYTFGWCWSFEVKDHGKEGKLVWVLGRLTIVDPKTFQPMIVKEQFGRADVKTKRNSDEYLDFGNDLKAASTDALKKCAAELGIASDIYGKNEFKEVQATGGKLEKINEPMPKKEEVNNGVDYHAQLKVELWKKCGKKANMTEWSACEMLAKKTGVMVNKISQLTNQEAKIALAKLLK